MSDAQAINESLFKCLSEGSRGVEAAAAIGAYTRDKMTRLYHVPHRYFLPPATEADRAKCDSDLRKLCTELGNNGFILLNEAGMPACLHEPSSEGVAQ